MCTSTAEGDSKTGKVDRPTWPVSQFPFALGVHKPGPAYLDRMQPPALALSLLATSLSNQAMYHTFQSDALFAFVLTHTSLTQYQAGNF